MNPGTNFNVVIRRLEVEWSDHSWSAGMISPSRGRNTPTRLNQSGSRWLGGRISTAWLRPGGRRISPRMLRFRNKPGRACARPGSPLQSNDTRKLHNNRTKSMKQPFPVSCRRSRGFTLVEMLVVIAIIGILAGLLLPTLATVKNNARKKLAKTDMANLAAAITAYESEYQRPPASKGAEDKAFPDFTYGGRVASGGGSTIEVQTGNGYEANNSEIIEILLDITDPGRPNAVNFQSKRNPRHLTSLNARQVSAPNAGISTADWVFRDPWSNPYIITIDMNDDNKCLDGFYRKRAVSQKGGAKGINGLVNSNPNPNTDNFELNGSVMIWSLGPDAQANDGVKADQGVNDDNILSWQ